MVFIERLYECGLRFDHEVFAATQVCPYLSYINIRVIGMAIRN